jgi:carbon starvation protein CstA
MAVLPSLLIFFVIIIIIALLVILIFASIRKETSGLKLMLLGISIILFGGIFAVDTDANLGGIEYIIAFLGLIISIAGFGKRIEK